MYIPVIPPTGEKSQCSEVSARKQAAALIILGLFFTAALGTLVYFKKGLSLGLMEMAIIGAVAVLALGGAFVLTRSGESEEKKRRPHQKNSHPIE